MAAIESGMGSDGDSHVSTQVFIHTPPSPEVTTKHSPAFYEIGFHAGRTHSHKNTCKDENTHRQKDVCSALMSLDIKLSETHPLTIP